MEIKLPVSYDNYNANTQEVFLTIKDGMELEIVLSLNGYDDNDRKIHINAKDLVKAIAAIKE